MLLFQRINWKLFRRLFFLIGLFTFLSFWAVVADGENGPSSQWWIISLVKSFDVSRWPTLYLYNWDEGPWTLFVGGLFLNVLLLSFLVERLVYFIKGLIKGYSKSNLQRHRPNEHGHQSVH
jgi:hypothetical protein